MKNKELTLTIITIHYFRLLTVNGTIKQILEYIGKYSDCILQASKATAMKVLEHSPSLPNIVDCLHGLKELSKLVDSCVWSTEPLPKVRFYRQSMLMFFTSFSERYLHIMFYFIGIFLSFYGTAI